MFWQLLMCGTGNISVSDFRQNHNVIYSGRSFSKVKKKLYNQWLERLLQKGRIHCILCSVPDVLRCGFFSRHNVNLKHTTDNIRDDEMCNTFPCYAINFPLSIHVCGLNLLFFFMPICLSSVPGYAIWTKGKRFPCFHELNASGSLIEWKKLWKHLPSACVPKAVSSCPKLPWVLP